MRLEKIRIRNFRLLRRFSIDLATDKTTTILVGPNNSGKTSVLEALRLFVGLSEGRKRFSIHDFARARQKDFHRIERRLPAIPQEEDRIKFVRRFAPRMRVELLFSYEDKEADLAIAHTLLMNLDPGQSKIAARIEFAIDDAKGLLADFAARRRQQESLFEFLREKLGSYYALSAFKISKDGEEAEPLDSPDTLKRVIKIDLLPAQRHMDDDEAPQAAKLSKLIHGHYERYYKLDDATGYGAIEDAIKASADDLTGRYQVAFTRLTTRLRNFGYPQGHASPDMRVKAEMNAETLYRDNTRIFYANDVTFADGTTETFELPEKYNGLGYKNLIYMVLQLETFRAALEKTTPDRPPVHIIGIEEPEAHLHPQMQCVFIKEISRALEGQNGPTSQILLSTHSPHMLADSGFDPIRYFKRTHHEVSVRDLSRLKLPAGSADVLSFLKRYLKLTHCDLFFADKAVLVEGQVERLLLPLMIEDLGKQPAHTHFPTQYVTILEVGGAYAHVFKPLIDFIEIPTLVITDIDSVDAQRQKCRVAQGVGSSNASLTGWIPAKPMLADLRAAIDEQKIDRHTRVAYQNDENNHCGRSFEEAFVYANLDWLTQNHAKLTATGSEVKKAVDAGLAGAAYDLAATLTKVDFALDLVAQDGWNTPRYIAEGLDWLSRQQVA